jgi:hypothetical protein
VLEESSQNNNSLSRYSTSSAFATLAPSHTINAASQTSTNSHQNNHNHHLSAAAHQFSNIFEMLEENMNGSSSSSSTYDMNGHRMDPDNSSNADQPSISANGTSSNNNCGSDYTRNGIMNHNSHLDQYSTQQNQNVQLDNTNRDIVRLIGQHLKLIGLERTAQMLMQESGCTLEHPAATKFRDHVLSGDWHKADYDLQELQTIVDDDKLTKHNLIEMKFLLLEQKYLEYLDDSRPIDALHVLRNELTPLQHNTPRVHQLSSYMMCTNNQVLY